MSKYGPYLEVNEGHLEIEGWDTVALAEKYGTPLRVISENTIRENYRRFFGAFKSMYPKVGVAFGSKSNHRLAVLRILVQEGAGLDVVGLGQLYVAPLVGCDPDKIVFNGNNKSEEELRAAVQVGVGHVNVDSLDELEMLNRAAGDLGKVATINIRVKLPYEKLKRIEPELWSSRESKFGIDVPSGQAFEACERAIALENVDLKGIHHHVGFTGYKGEYSKDIDLMRHGLCAEELMDFAGTLKEKTGFEVDFIDFGGGLRKVREAGFARREVREAPSVEEYADRIVSVVREKIGEYNLREPTIQFETGGYLVTDAEILLSRVGNIKQDPGGKWVAVDTSAYKFVRKLIHNMYHHTIVANKADLPPEETVDLVGPICAYDNISDKVSIPKVERGDLIATLDQGSYCDVISTHYCAYPDPATILVNKDTVDVVRKRESIQDLFALDIVPPRLFQNR